MTTAILFLLTTAALANDPPAEATPCAGMEGDAAATCQAEQALATATSALEALGDCTALEGEAATTCASEKSTLEAKIKEMTPKEAPAAESKGGKAKRANTNRMEEEEEELQM